MRRLRVVLVALCVAAASLVVSAGPANATPTPVLPPTVFKSFDPTTIPLNGTANFQVGVSNPNAATTLTGVTVTDTMPAGLVITTPFNGTFCGGTFAVTANSISMTGLTLSPADVCTIGGLVQGTTLGPKVNTATVTSTNGGPGTPATATLVVANQPPIMTKAFAPSTVAVGGTTTLTFTLTNPNPSVALSRITFADPFPGGLAVAANPAVTNTCGGVPSVGPFASGGRVCERQPSCGWELHVQRERHRATSAGVKNNTTTIISSSAGIGSPATGTLTVNP